MNKEFIVGEYKYQPTGRYELMRESDILNSGWLSGLNMPKEVVTGHVFFQSSRMGMSRSSRMQDEVSTPYIVIESESNNEWRCERLKQTRLTDES